MELLYALFADMKLNSIFIGSCLQFCYLTFTMYAYCISWQTTIVNYRRAFNTGANVSKTEKKVWDFVEISFAFYTTGA